MTKIEGIKKKITHRQMAQLLVNFIHIHWPTLINPPELNINVHIPAHIEGFSHIKLSPTRQIQTETKVGLLFGIKNRPVIRFVRKAVIPIRKNGKPHEPFPLTVKSGKVSLTGLSIIE